MKLHHKKFFISLCLLVLSSCIKPGNILQQSNLNQPIGPGNPGSGSGGGTGGVVSKTDSLFVATYDGKETIFELKDVSISKHTVLPDHARFGTAVLLDNKIYYSLESTRFDVLGVSEVYELDVKSGVSKKISQFHQELYKGVSAITKAGKTLYASVRSSNSGFELHKYNNGQWSLVKDIESGVVGSYPAMFIEFNQNSYFLAYQSGSGMELWSTNSDGVLHSNIYTGAASSHVMPWFIKDAKIFVTAKNPSSTSYDLYSVNEQGLAQKAVSPSSAASAGANPLSVYAYKAGAVSNCHHDASGRELCVSQNLADQWKVIEINAGSKSSNPKFFVNYKDQVYFQAEGNQGVELYRSNGDNAELVKDLKTGIDSSYPENLMVIGGKLYFSAYDKDGPSMFSYDGSDVVKVTLEQKNLKYARSLLNPSR